MMAQEEALEAIANSESRRLVAIRYFDFADVMMGGSVIFNEPDGRKSAPKWRGPAVIVDIDGTGAAAKFQRGVPTVARYCARKRVGRLSWVMWNGIRALVATMGRGFSHFC